MPTSGSVSLNGGHVAIYLVVENGETRELQRIAINKSDGTEGLPLGTQGAGTTYNPPTGGSDVLGYLSGIYAASIDTSDQGVVINGIRGREYETVAASQTGQVLGATGAAGDDLDGVLIVPANVTAGAVSIKDGAGSAITIFAGGTTSLSNLVPFYVPLGLRSVAGAWSITTGASVSAIGIGNFT